MLEHLSLPDLSFSRLPISRREARAAVAEGGTSDPRDHILRAALVFGLGEVMDSLEDLVEVAEQSPTG